jgi:heptosyltransferase-1
MKSILIVRIGAMGDIIHALPGVASLRKTFPQARITWVVEPRWTGLLTGSGLVDRIVEFHRHEPATWATTRAELRREKYDLGVDFQGSTKSALVARAAGPKQLFGYGAGIARERPAAWFYSRPVRTKAKHVVDQGLDLAAAAGAAARAMDFPLPAGAPEGKLPDEPFVLASPLAGWPSKQWPMEYFAQLARELRMPLVVNGAPGAAPDIPGAWKHECGIAGLIDATRRAALVVGVDSGPLHLAAAMGKPGVAIFGPTDPERNGPRGGDFAVFRQTGAATTHRRGTEIDVSMRAISPEMILHAMESRIACRV